jgi:23S rRNA pseudouridine955/2504/2580 synthase
MRQETTFTAGPNDNDTRLDRLLRKLLRDIPLSHIYRMIRRGQVRVNGRRAKTGTRVQEGDQITVPKREGAEATPASDANGHRQGTRGASADPTRPAPGNEPPQRVTRRRSLDIVFESDDILVVNKPCGALTHGPSSLEEDVREYLSATLPADLSFRPGPLHRLDRNTSGAVAFSKSIEGARTFSEALHAGKISKTYVAVLTGAIVETTRWDFPIARRHESRTSRYDPDGKPARTWVFPVRAIETQGSGGEASFPAGHYTLAILRITTGRTHQIRVHAATAGNAVAGDTKYDAPPLRGGMILHAWMLAATGHDSPATELFGHSSVEAPLPADATSRISAAFGGDAITTARELATHTTGR